MGQGSLRRFSRLPVRLVLLDQQHDVRADGDALFRRRFGLCAGSGPPALADNKLFTVVASVGLMALLVILNIVGLGVGKWINNLRRNRHGRRGGVLIGLGVIVFSKFGTTVTAADFRIPAESTLRAEFFWRDLLWAGRPRTRIGDGRRNQGPAKNPAGRGRLGWVLSGVLYIAPR